jgi:hypothetical protein
MLKAVFHPLVMVIYGHGKNLFGLVLVDDKLVKIFLYHMRLYAVQLVVDGLLSLNVLLGLLRLVMLLDKVVYILYAVGTKGKTGTGIVDWHVILGFGDYLSLTEATGYRGVITVHKISTFLYTCG